MEMGKVRGVKCFVNLFNGLPVLYSVSFQPWGQVENRALVPLYYGS